MTEHALETRLVRTPWPWLVAAGTLGAASGLAAAQGTLWAGALAALGVGAAFVWLAWLRLDVALVALLFTLPLDVYGRVITTPVTVTVFQLGLLAILAAWLARVALRADATLRFSTVDLGAAALLAAGLWSLPHSLAPSATMFGIVRFGFLWAFEVMYANGIRTSKQLERVVRFLVVTGVLIGLLAIVQYRLPGFHFGIVRAVRTLGGGTAFSRASGLFQDPNYLAGFISACFVAACAMLVHSKGRADAAWWMAGAGVTGLALLVTFSRSGWVGAAVGLVVVLVTAPRRRRAGLIAVAAALAVAIVIAAPPSIVSRTKSIGAVSTDLSVATRYYMVFSTVEMIRDRWVWGTGLAAYDKAYPPYRKPGTLLTILKPHQLPLALWAEMGIAGLLAELALVGGVIAVFWRRRPQGWGPLESVALAGLLTLSTQTFFQYYLYFEYPWLFLALSVAATRIARREEGTGA
jgi:O-antigen ligase